MGIRDVFRRRFSMDGDSVVTEKELRNALAKAHDVFESTLKYDIDRDSRFHTQYNVDPRNPNYMTVDLTYGEGKNKSLIGRITIDKHSGDYKVESFYDSKEQKYQKQGSQVAQTSDFGEDHTPRPKADSKQVRGQFVDAGDKLRKRQGDGEWHLMKEVHERGARVSVRGGSNETGSIEYGDIVIVDPSGNEKFRGAYISGPRKGGMHADRNSYAMNNSTEMFGVEGGGQLLGHRVSGSKYLIHQELGAPGTAGCYGLVRPNAMNEYASVWNQIPPNQRPDNMERHKPVHVDRNELAQERAMIAARGFDFRHMPQVRDVDTRYLAQNGFTPPHANHRGGDRERS